MLKKTKKTHRNLLLWWEVLKRIKQSHLVSCMGIYFYLFFKDKERIVSFFNQYLVLILLIALILFILFPLSFFNGFIRNLIYSSFSSLSFFVFSFLVRKRVSFQYFVLCRYILIKNQWMTRKLIFNAVVIRKWKFYYCYIFLNP